MLDVIPPNPIEREMRAVEWCDREGVEILLLDLDDTICGTKTLFDTQIQLAADYLSERKQIEYENGWKGAINLVSNRFYLTHGVNPIKWSLTMDELAKMYNLTESITKEAKAFFPPIYTTPVEFLEGALEGLTFIKNVRPFRIVTHANEQWTWRKYDWLQLNRFLPKEHVFIVSEDGHKTKESWQNAVAHFGFFPKQCAGFGDSPKSDVIPMQEIGIEHRFLIDIGGDKWVMQDQEVDEETIKIKNLSYFADAILQS